MHNQITQADAVKAIGEYAAFLRNAERSEATIAKCIRDLRLFFYFSVRESVRQIGRAIVDCKGKTRTVFLPKDRCL